MHFDSDFFPDEPSRILLVVSIFLLLKIGLSNTYQMFNVWNSFVYNIFTFKFLGVDQLLYEN